MHNHNPFSSALQTTQTGIAPYRSEAFAEDLPGYDSPAPRATPQRWQGACAGSLGNTAAGPARTPLRALGFWLLLAGLAVLGSTPPVVAATAAAAATAQATNPPGIQDDLQMMQDAEPFRRTADSFIARAQAGDGGAALAMLSRTLLARAGEPAVRRAMEGQILPFFASGRAGAGSVTVTRTTDAAGQSGFAFYMWLAGAGGGMADKRPFTVYVVEEQGRRVVANVVPDRLVEGRHR